MVTPPQHTHWDQLWGQHMLGPDGLYHFVKRAPSLEGEQFCLQYKEPAQGARPCFVKRLVLSGLKITLPCWLPFSCTSQCDLNGTRSASTAAQGLHFGVCAGVAQSPRAI